MAQRGDALIAEQKDHAMSQLLQDLEKGVVGLEPLAGGLPNFESWRWLGGHGTGDSCALAH